MILRAGQGLDLSRDEIIELLSLDTPGDMEGLFQAADRVRKEYVGDEVFLRGIIEFSNYCRNNCLYCGLRRDNLPAERYRMEDDEILGLAKAIQSRACSTVVLQSGEDPLYNRDRMCRIITRIKDDTGLAITLSIGTAAL